MHNFMSPQNWLCRSERNPALDPHGDNAYSPPNARHETHGDIQSSIPTTATYLSSKMQKTQSLTRPTTHAATSTSQFAISSQYLTSLNSTSLAAPKANPIFHAANKNLFIKIYFDYRHLTSSSFYLYFSQPSVGTNNIKRGYKHNVNTHTLQPFLATNNKNSGYKMVPPR